MISHMWQDPIVRDVLKQVEGLPDGKLQPTDFFPEVTEQ